MSTFNEFLGHKESVVFTDGSVVVSREHFSKEEALEIYRFDLDSRIELKHIRERFVHFHIEWDDEEEEHIKAWYLRDDYVKGAKKV